MKWYVVHTYTGHERKVQKSLENTVATRGLSNSMGRILIPTEEQSKLKGGKKTILQKQLYPSYILIEMELSEETIQAVTTTPGVTGFVGTRRNKPQPLSDSEVERILNRMEGEKGKTRIADIPFSKGDSVKVIDGPFRNFTGTVEDIYPDREKIKVMISIFGRRTPLELDYIQVVAI